MPCTVFAGALALTGGATAFVHQRTHERDEARFADAVTTTLGRLESEMESDEALLLGAAGLFAAREGTIDADDFHRYVERLELPTRFPGVRGIGFAERLAADEIVPRTEELRATGRPEYAHFRVRPALDAPGYERPDAFVILYLQPLDDANRVALGFDMGSDSARRAAMQRACDEGHAALTPRVSLVQGGQYDAGFLMYVPIYQGGAVPPTVEGRRAALRGFVYSPFWTDELLRPILAEDPGLRHRLYDEDLLLFDGAPGTIRSTRTMAIGGRTWTLVSAPSGSEPGDGAAALLAVFGVAFSAALLSATRAQVRARADADGLVQTLEQRVQRRTAELREANRELEAFSYSVSHDLRAPLRHILGFAQLLAKRLGDGIDAEAGDHLQTIMDAARKGSRLVDELLEFSRMARVELLESKVSLHALVEEVLAELQPELHGRDVQIDVGTLPSVRGDAAMLRIVFRNLLANAVKYTRRRAAAHIAVHGAVDGGEVIVTVSDDGAGFDMAHADKLFGVFERLHAASEFEGTGIGLAIVRRIAERHGGRVWARGEVDRGATFSVSLPKGGSQERTTDGT